MVRVIPVLFVLLFAVAPPAAVPETGWLASSHPRITLKLDYALEPNCLVDCDRYLLILSYRSAADGGAEAEREWRSISSAGCLDVTNAGKGWVACRLASSLAGTSRNGDQYALLRFRLERPQVDQLLATGAVLRLDAVSFRLSADARQAVAAFLANDV